MLSYFKLDINNLQFGQSDVSGVLNIEYSPTRITGNFKSKNLIIKDFTGDSNPNGEYSIPETPFPVDMLRDSVFDFKAKISNIDIADLHLRNVSISTKNENNVIKVQFLPPASIIGGKLDLSLSYDLKPKSPVMSLQAKTSTLQLAAVLNEMFGKEPITGSTLDCMANLTGHGGSLKNIVDTMSGQILFHTGPGQFQNSIATTSIGSIFTNVLTSVITFDKRAPTSAFKCGVMNFRVSNGVANAKQGIALEGANVNVLGNGMVDLRNGRIAFSMVPQTLSANPIDIANFSVAQMVEVNGTLSNPNVTVNATNLLAQGATAVVTAGLTGGLTSGLSSVLATAGILNNNAGASNNITPCKTALDN